MAELYFIDFVFDDEWHSFSNKPRPDILPRGISKRFVVSISKIDLWSNNAWEVQDFLDRESSLFEYWSLEDDSVSRENSDTDTGEVFRVCWFCWSHLSLIWISKTRVYRALLRSQAITHFPSSQTSVIRIIILLTMYSSSIPARAVPKLESKVSAERRHRSKLPSFVVQSQNQIVNSFLQLQ